jgi:hypothetical protein
VNVELLSDELWESLIPLVFLLFFLAVFLIRVLRDDQRATARLFGKRPVVKGPGLVLRVPLLHQDWRKHRVGDRGVMHDSGKVLFRGALVDAVIEGSFRAGDPVTLLRFRGDRFVVGSGTR